MRFLKKGALELVHHKALCAWIAHYPHIDRYFFHIPNGLLKNTLSSQELRARGVKRGLPDFFLAIPKSPYNGLFIELKRDKRAPASAEQNEWLQAFSKGGYAATIAIGWLEAKTIITQYLGGCYGEV